VVGYSSTSSDATHAVLWDKGKIIDLGSLGSNDTYAYSINNAGKIVGYSKTTKGYRALLWDKGSIKYLNNLIPSNSGWQLGTAVSINDRGQIVGQGEYKGKTRAFLLTPIK
jgi:probable HAF family extracellular repeat protein